MSNLIDQAYSKAIEILKRNLTPYGFMAGGKLYSNQVWARDSCITGLGILQSKDKELIQGLKKSLESLKRSQTELGMIPSFFSPNYIDYGKSGTIDSSLWYIILIEKYYSSTNDKKFLQEFWSSLKKAYTWLKYQDQNNFSLLGSQKSGEMFDASIQRSGKVLYVNLLWYQTLKSIYYLSQTQNQIGMNFDLDLKNYPNLPSTTDILKTKDLINLLFWPEKGGLEKMYFLTKNYLEWDNSKVYQKHINPKRKHYLMFVDFEDYEEHFDTLANLLAIIFEITDQEKEKKILDYIEKNKINQPFPIKCLYPVVKDKKSRIWNNDVDKQRDKYWQSTPYHYWNTGIWPFIGGFYIWALVRTNRLEQAKYHLEKLALLNKKNNWQFNEWFDGLKAKPCGQPFQSWNAGMYLVGYLKFIYKIVKV